MASYLLLGLCGFLLVCAVVDAQKSAFTTGPYGDQVYVRNGQEGSYTVPGVKGNFQSSPSRGEYVYTDEQGNTYTHHKGGGGAAGSHSISGPGLVAHNPPSRDAGYGSADQPQRRARSPQFHVSRPDRTVDVGSDGSFLARRARNPQFYISRPDRTVDVGSDGSFLARRSRSPQFHISRPDRTVDVGSDGSFIAQRRVRSPQVQVVRPGQTVYFEPGAEIHAERPGHSVHISNGNVLVQRKSRSPHHHPDHHEPHDDHADAQTHDHHDEHKRVRRARVQGENFVARDNQAGVWNDNVSVWKRPDGRTVTVDAQGNVITSGSPNGRGPQYYSG